MKESPELNLAGWKSFIKDYDIILDSLWLIENRDNSGAHKQLLHGGFVPQVPRQAILRFTKRKETVIDAFLGYGTTLIECRRWGRNGVGIEIENEIISIGRARIEGESNLYSVKTPSIQGDSQNINIVEVLEKEKLDLSSLIILHPPYHNIIKYGENIDNLCNSSSRDLFLINYGQVVKNILDALKSNGYLMVVIGDKYENGEWIPLGFEVMNKTLEFNMRLKSICVKNIVNTIAKRNQIQLWKYRALKNGFYNFKHEYVMIFQKG